MTTTPNVGEVIISAVIRARGIYDSIKTDEGNMFIWSANAEEQIEAALEELGYKLIPIQQ
jgi:hypothetical protein